MGISVFPVPASGITASDLITGQKYTLLSSSSTSNVASITFSNIPQTYKNLRIVTLGIYPSSGGVDFRYRINNDSGTVYHQGLPYLTGNNWQAFGKSNLPHIIMGFGDSVGTSVSGNFGYSDILDYTNTTQKEKWIRNRVGHNQTSYWVGDTTESFYRPSSAAAVTSLVFSYSSGNILNDGTTNYGIYLFGWN